MIRELILGTVIGWSSQRSDGIYWFRIHGIGISIKDVNKHSLLFSERNGYTKTLRIKNYSIKLLTFR